MKPPFMPFSGSVTAMTIAKSASLPPVMNVFSPVEHPVVTVAARGRPDRAGSDPAPGSVIAKHDFALALDRRQQVLLALLLVAS